MKPCKTCSKSPVCDFCIFFEYNGDEYTDDRGAWPNAVYVGKGYCRKFDMNTDPSGGCDEFKCKNITSEV